MTSTSFSHTLSADLAATREALDALERRNPRRTARLRLDFLDARTEHSALRLSELELLAETRRIRAEAGEVPAA